MIRSLSKRLAALESRASHLPPPRVEDDEIIEILRHGTRDPLLYGRALEALFAAIQPALENSVVKGASAHEYCRLRGIERPTPVGPVDLLARLTAHEEHKIPNEVRERWMRLVGDVNDWLLGLDEDPVSHLTPDQVRAILVVTMAEVGRFPAHSVHYRFLSEISKPQADRLLSLVEPLESRKAEDLPLLVWVDDRNAVHTSMGSTPGDVWMPVDVGLRTPGYLFLASADSSSLTQEPLKRKIPAVDPRPISDEDLIQSLRWMGNSVLGTPDMVDALFVRIEPYLLGAVVVGAQSLRDFRRTQTQSAPPNAPVDQAATVASYDTTPEIPPDSLTVTDWLIPGHRSYDMSTCLTSAAIGIAGIRRGLVFRLLENHGVLKVRSMRPADLDLPLPDNDEVARILSLVELLRWDPDPDLPLLIWSGGDGSLWSSWASEIGQSRSKADRTNHGQDFVLLADRSLTHNPRHSGSGRSEFA